MSGQKSKTIALMGLFIALCYVGTMLNIPLTIGGGKTMFHFGNTFCLLAALTLGGVKGGITGSLGMGLYDLTSAGFQMYAPQTAILKFFIGLICGVAYKKLTIKNETTKIAVACSAGMIFNIIFDPIASYFTSTFLLGVTKDLSSVLAKMSAVTTFANAIIAVVVATILYKALKPVISKVRG